MTMVLFSSVRVERRQGDCMMSCEEDCNEFSEVVHVHKILIGTKKPSWKNPDKMVILESFTFTGSRWLKTKGKTHWYIVEIDDQTEKDYSVGDALLLQCDHAPPYHRYDTGIFEKSDHVRIEKI